MTGRGRRTVLKTDPEKVPSFEDLKKSLLEASPLRLDPMLRSLNCVLYVTGGRIGEGMVVRANQFTFDVEAEGEDGVLDRWMVVRGWPVEKKKEPTFRDLSERMANRLVGPIKWACLKDLERDKPLFRQWGKSKWQQLQAKQLPDLFFHLLRSARITHLLDGYGDPKQAWPAEKVAKWLNVDIRYIIRVYWRVTGRKLSLGLPRVT